MCWSASTSWSGAIREQAFPDGTLTLRYGFVHVLYQNALYAALQPTRKAAWSAAAARALLAHYGEKSAGLAAELAMLFEAARDHERAADYYLVAAENAARIFAHHEAVALARRGLALLETLPDTPDRARRELPLQVTLGMQLQVAQGYAAPEAERIYARARALCEQVQEAPPLFPVLWGLWMFYEVRSRTREIAGAGRAALHAGPEGPGSGPAPPGPPGAGGHVALPRRPGRHARTHGARGCPVRPQATRQPHLSLRPGSRSGVPGIRGGGPLAARLSGPGGANAAARRSPWAGSWANPARSPWRCTSPPCSGSTAARGRRSRKAPRPQWRSRPSTGFRSG